MYLFLLCCNCHCRGLDNKAWGGQTEGRKGSPTHQSSTLLYFSTNIFAIKIAQTVTEVPRKSERTNRISSGPLVQNVQCVFQRFLYDFVFMFSCIRYFCVIRKMGHGVVT